MPIPIAAWKRVRDRAADKERLLRFADFLGRGRGRMRFLDHVGSVPGARVRPDLSGWEGHGLAAAWIGHATTLIRGGGGGAGWAGGGGPGGAGGGDRPGGAAVTGGGDHDLDRSGVVVAGGGGVGVDDGRAAAAGEAGAVAARVAGG